MRCFLRFLPLAALAILAPSVTAQTMRLDYSAGAATAGGSSADYAVTFSASPVQSFLDLTPGVTVSNVDFGMLSLGAAGHGANNVIETAPFSFDRPLILSLNTESAASAPEALSGMWGAERAGSAGQYLVTNLDLDGNSATYDFGLLGTVRADFQPGMAFSDGLGGPATIPILANLTYQTYQPPAAVPETPPIALLALGCPLLAGLALRARKRRSTE